MADSSKHFSRAELQCSKTGECNMSYVFLDRLEILRAAYGRPMRLSSAYRQWPDHPAEAHKDQPGRHALGVAVDVLVHGKDALDLLALALDHGFNGIGVSQRDKNRKNRFLHLDMRENGAIWSY